MDYSSSRPRLRALEALWANSGAKFCYSIRFIYSPGLFRGAAAAHVPESKCKSQGFYETGGALSVILSEGVG